MVIEKRVGKKAILLVVSLILFFSLINIVFAADEWPVNNFCCEKVKDGGWCQNVKDGGSCEQTYNGQSLLGAPTRCDSTSFCQLGCCLDSSEGICMQRSSRRVCETDGGAWVPDVECNVPQCSLGCCVLGDQASFVTLTRCKKMSGTYGLKTDFRPDIIDEASCSEIAYLQDKGACVYEVDFQKTCKFTTRQECSSGEEETGKEFYSGFLCTNTNLSADCAPTSKTTCVEGKDEVYWTDTCGNPANIYDTRYAYSEKSKGQPANADIAYYWDYIVKKDYPSDPKYVCGAGTSNANSAACGNCDYFKGSICAKGRTATYGDYYCRDLSCPASELLGRTPKNGESWCEVGVISTEIADKKVKSIDEKTPSDPVGSRYFRHICIQGEEIIEPCADFRTEVCYQSDNVAGEFTEAACRTNRWEDCVDQTDDYDCLNIDKRDCYWIESVPTSQKKDDEDKNIAEKFGISLGVKQSDYKDTFTGKCVPKNPPGLKFWEKSDATEICSLGSSTCDVKYEGKLIPTGPKTSGLLGEKEITNEERSKGNFLNKVCVENCQCLKEDWRYSMSDVCSSLGDCGAYININKVATNRGAEWKFGGTIQSMGDAMLKKIIQIKSGFSDITWWGEKSTTIA